MKLNAILICLLFAIAASSFTAAKAQVNTSDSLALVDLYKSTDGHAWRHHTNWLTTEPLDTWYGVTVTNNRVTYLYLTYNNLKGTIPATIGNLTSLTHLLLDINYLRGAIPAEIGNLVNLQVLSLRENKLSGAIPASIGNLTNLYNLGLYTNQLSGAIPASIGNLVNLHFLELNSNQLSGPIPAEIGKLIQLDDLELGYNQLTGIIPPEISNLINLYELNLENNQLRGTIPAEIGKLVNLTILYLLHNQLSGTIPASIGNLVNLNSLILTDNQLTGTIPAEIGNLVNLTVLVLGSNKLRSAIPASIGKLTKLTDVDLSFNQLSGSIPFTVKYLTALYTFYINNNHLSQSSNISFASNNANKTHVNVSYNDNNFNGLEFLAKKCPNASYAPQARIPLYQNSGVLYTSAGGTPSNNTYKWFKDSMLVATITADSTFMPAQNGTYYATVTNAIATQLTLYSDTISYTAPLAQTQNSIANVAAAKAVTNHFSIYPNPAKDIIHVQANGAAMIVLTNSAGKILFSKSINTDSEINVSSYANGVYYIQNKTTGETQKVVVVH